METAIRELEEESGLLPKDVKIYGDDATRIIIRYLVKNEPKTVVYWLAELIDSTVEVKLSKEHKDFKWLCLTDACKITKKIQMQQMLKFYDNYILNNIN